MDDCLASARFPRSSAYHPEWWQRHWARTGIVEVEAADTLLDGWRLWLDWHRAVAPDNAAEITALAADCGRYLGYIRAVGRRRADVLLEEPVVSVPPQYIRRPLSRHSNAEPDAAADGGGG
jgi:hypothetical protein